MSVDLLLQLHEQCKGLLAKSDGKDKTIALLQYAAMFASGGEPGTALAVQKSLAAARKAFRLYKPIEILVPFLRSPPDFAANAANAAVEYAKNIGMAHLVGCGLVVGLRRRRRQTRPRQEHAEALALGLVHRVVRGAVRANRRPHRRPGRHDRL